MSLLQNFCFVTKDSIYFERSCNSLHLDSIGTKSKDIEVEIIPGAKHFSMASTAFTERLV